MSKSEAEANVLNNSSGGAEQSLPVFPMRSTVLLPGTVTAVQMAYAPNVAAMTAHPEDEFDIVFVHLATDEELPDPKLLERVGVRSRVLDRMRLPEGQIQITIQTLNRVWTSGVRYEDGYYVASSVKRIQETPVDPERADEHIARILTLAEGMASAKRSPAEIPRLLRANLSDPGDFADRAAALLRLRNSELDALVQMGNVGERLGYLQSSLEEIWSSLQASDQPSRGPDQRSTPEELRQRIRALEIELGETSPAEREYISLMRRVDSTALPTKVESAARLEVERIRALPTVSDDAADARRHLDALLEMPWKKSAATGPLNITEVAKVLKEDFLGLDDAKETLLELLSVSTLRGDMKSQIPCLVGPPKVGKHSLVAAVSKALGRPLQSVSVSGRGEEELGGRSSRRPQGKMGSLATAFREAGVKDPVLLLEDLDRLGVGKITGEPVEIMESFLHAHAEHEEFVDAYLDAPLDVSDAVLFATAHDFYSIPSKIRDRFVEVRLSGYTPEEKVRVVKEKLLPRYATEMGLDPDAIEITEDTLLFLTRNYARDPGMGNLRRSLRALLRHCALERAVDGEQRWDITPEWIDDVLGPPRYPSTPAEAEPEVGVVTGLAWTASGGELLFVEALRMPGGGGLSFTGLLGDVMQESIQAAFSYVRSQAERLNIDLDVFRQSDLHVHFPGGAIPKDGPSAGAAVTLALASVFSGLPVRHDIALTGEMTLRGKILEIGGVKEKVLAAYRAGIQEVVLPKGNARDLREVPEAVRSEMTIHLVEQMDEIFALALIDPSKQNMDGEGELPTRTGVDELGGIFIWQPDGAVFLNAEQAARLKDQLPRLIEIAREHFAERAEEGMGEQEKEEAALTPSTEKSTARKDEKEKAQGGRKRKKAASSAEKPATPSRKKRKKE